VPTLEDVLRALACVAAGKPIRSQSRAVPHSRSSITPRMSLSPRRGSSLISAAPLPPPPPPLPPSAWRDRASNEGVSELRALFAFEMCAPALMLCHAIVH
jgi:hypothetical protein